MDRGDTFQSIVDEVKACTRCPRMGNSKRIFGYSSGSPLAPLMFVGEAPGRLGADNSSIPFHGDKAGENFESLIEQVGISRYECFVTNAVLCNPKDEKGNNATPNKPELANCSGFLRRQIDVLQPVIVVTLGAQALAATRMIENHQIELASGVRRCWDWYRRKLIPIYHPGQRAMIHRSYFNQLSDYQFIAETYRRAGRRGSAKNYSPSTHIASEIVRQILHRCGPISYFKLHKLFYLAEYEHFKQKGERLTSAYMVRQKDGPYVVELNYKRLRKSLPELRLTEKAGRLIFDIPADMFTHSSSERLHLTNEVRSCIQTVCDRYAMKPDHELKTIVYLTTPMKALLRREKLERRGCFNAPIDFSISQQNNG